MTRRAHLAPFVSFNALFCGAQAPATMPRQLPPLPSWFANVPADTGQVDEVYFSTPWVRDGRLDPERWKATCEVHGLDTPPPRLQIRYIDSHHEIAGEGAVVQVLENELRGAMLKPDVALVRPQFLKAQFVEEVSAELEVRTTRHKGQEPERLSRHDGAAAPVLSPQNTEISGEAPLEPCFVRCILFSGR